MSSITDLLTQAQAPNQNSIDNILRGDQDWLTIAETDPAIQMWWSSLQAAHPDIRGVPLRDYLLHEQDLFAGGEGVGYDTKSAIEHGLRPQMVDDYTYHWLGRNPITGYFYKGKGHPTRALSERDVLEDNQ